MKHFILAILFALSTGQLSAHCQIPCGIYHDQMVVNGLKEDVETLTKSVNAIHTNAKVTAQDQNQLIRWVMNKEKHADKLANTLVEYFLKQRITLDAEKLQDKVVSVHKMLVLSMKVKQSVDLGTVAELKKELNTFITLMDLDHPENH